MLDATRFVEIISGDDRSFSAMVLRGLFQVLTPVYAAGVWIRNRKFDRGRGVRRVSVPVISVGNLTTGGTGKTPMILQIAKLLGDQGHRVVLISRGYQSGESGKNDEAMELENRLPGVVHLQNPDRIAAAESAIEVHRADVILLDDGFQHRRLGRDLDIVLIDGTNPFGFDRLLPRGLLREPVGSLGRADLVILTRAELVDRNRLEEIRRQVGLANPSVPIWECETRPLGWLDSEGGQVPLSDLANASVVSFCGIGNPSAFERQLELADLDLRQSLVFPDHHHFDAADFSRIAEAVERQNPTAVVCTHKDLVKIDRSPFAVPLLALQIESRVRDEGALANLVNRVVGGN